MLEHPAAPHTLEPGSSAATVVFAANANAIAGETVNNPSPLCAPATAWDPVTYVGVRGVINVTPAGATAAPRPDGNAAANTSTSPLVTTGAATVATVTFVAIVTVTAAPTPATAPAG